MDGCISSTCPHPKSLTNRHPIQQLSPNIPVTNTLTNQFKVPPTLLWQSIQGTSQRPLQVPSIRHTIVRNQVCYYPTHRADWLIPVSSTAVVIATTDQPPTQCHLAQSICQQGWTGWRNQARSKCMTVILTKLKITWGMYIKTCARDKPSVQVNVLLTSTCDTFPSFVYLHNIVNSVSCTHALVCGPTSKHHIGKNSAMLQLRHKDYLLTFPLLSIARCTRLYNWVNFGTVA